ncbi:UNVERIFIED_CONTAM: Gibberellin 2-beta-dioxygenase 1 [Sesamum radiatum]|uniref:Gibberellin 2-beta-dioxygenase 1 n=1 Tax=Sesamum radiatum TaxID=300843 RepID=A0AAW2K6C2_SESRA
MVLLPKPAVVQHFSATTTAAAAAANPIIFPDVPLIDLSKPVKACEDFGFFKLINHSVPTQFITQLESEALNFFSLPLSAKQTAGPPDPFGYGNNKIGPNGDVGWVEYLLLTTHTESDYHKFASIFGKQRRNSAAL